MQEKDLLAKEMLEKVNGLGKVNPDNFEYLRGLIDGLVMFNEKEEKKNGKI